MVAIKVFTLFAGVAFVGRCNADSYSSPTQTCSPPADAICNVEGKRSGLSGLKPLGSYIGATSSSECLAICSDEHHAALCESFTYTPRTKACVFWDIPVQVGFTAEAGTGVFFWDIECFDGCSPTSTPVPTATPTDCLPSDVVCGEPCSFTDYDSFATYRRAQSQEECFDICSSGYYASRCLTFIYGDGSQTCWFFDAPASVAFTPAIGETNNAFYERVCFANTGPCESTTTSAGYTVPSE